MRRIILLALFALVLPTATLATTFKFETGDFSSGTVSGSVTTMLDVTIVGGDNTITFNTGPLSLLTSCAVGAQCYGFTGGTVTVTNPGGTTIFTSNIATGDVTKFPIGFLTLNAALLAEAPLTSANMGASWFESPTASGTLLLGAAQVEAMSPIPEPGTLGLLGTGLIGLAGMARRQLKFWT